MKKTGIIILLLIISFSVFAQTDSLKNATADSVYKTNTDSALRIINLNPFFSVHVDSVLFYQLLKNKNFQ